jgi:Tfp pilus assembly protein PilO
VKRNEQMILLGLVVVGLLVGFWLLVISPKRHEASDLQSQVDDLRSSLSQAQQDAATAESAKRSFGIDYRRLVVLGKAVPADSDQTSLLVQLQHLADKSAVRFNTFDLSDASTSSAATATTPTSTGSSDTSSSTDSSSTSSSTTTAAAAPSEAAVATLPIGASVGPAGLPVMPYTLTFTGGFVQIADFMQRLDSMVGMKGSLVDVRGRLLTVDGFHLTAAAPGSADAGSLTAELDVTSFLTPADQGITGGATPSGPAPATSTPVSSSTTTPDSTSTSTDTTSTTGSTVPTTSSATPSSTSVPTSTSP